jgi:hypothetical protein
MISALSTSNHYILQPGLVEMHRKSLEYLSATALWKRELQFFQKLLDTYAPRFTALEDKKKVDHFQSIIIFYSGELVSQLTKSLRQHEGDLARMLQSKNESDTQYFKDHNDLMNQLESFSKSYTEFHHDLYNFIERVM